MAVCRGCNQEMTDGAACTDPVYEMANGETYQRIPYGGTLDLFPDAGDRCHDCYTPRGGLHHPDCGQWWKVTGDSSHLRGSRLGGPSRRWRAEAVRRLAEANRYTEKVE
jgi:hypothetical protein